MKVAPAGARLDRIVDAIEVTAACFLAAVAALTFVSVILRYLFIWAIPDTYDISRLLLAILIFWGMSGTGYRGEHITVDLLWGAFGPRVRRAIDVFSNLVTLFAMAAFAYMMWRKVWDTRADHILTFDLGQPVWIYYLVAWLGLAASVPLVALRVYRLAFRPGSLQPRETSPSAE